MLKSALLITAFIVSATILGQAKKDLLLKEFANTKNDSVFITKHSTRPYQKYSVTRHYPFTVSYNLFDSLILFHGERGKILGPLELNDELIYIKIISIDSAYRMRVGNIWLNPQKRGEEAVEKLAEEILDTVKRTGDFDGMKKYSDDNIETHEADLGWFFQGVMVPEFEVEVLKHKKGDVYILSTRFGKHIIKSLDSPALDRSKVEYVLFHLDKK